MEKSFVSDDAGSEIARTGRFGIGALACFLLGSTIDVETRRLGQESGLKFNAELGKDAIEVTTIQREIGTKISIKIDTDKQEKVEALFNPIISKERKNSLVFGIGTAMNSRAFCAWTKI